MPANVLTHQFQVGNRRFSAHKARRLNAAGRIVDKDQQGAARCPAFEPSCGEPSFCTSSPSRARRARGGWKQTDRRLARHRPASRISVRVVSTENTCPCRSASIWQASVGPKSL